MVNEGVFLLDDEEVSLVIEAACPDAGNAANDQQAEAPNEDTQSLGPDMPDLPMDAPCDPDSSLPLASTAEASVPQEIQPAEAEQSEETAVLELEAVEEESTVREEPPPAEPQVEQEEAASGEQHEELSGTGEEQGEREETQQVEKVEEQQAESAVQAEEEVKEKELGEETPPGRESDEPGTEAANHPKERNAVPPEVPGEPAEGAPPVEVEGGEQSCVPCAHQSIFSSYNSHAPSRRKTRPCSLPVSELETVIASACGEPETPRSHYIRIHHLLHSLPSAQQGALSQEEESSNSTDGTTSTSPMLKVSKEEAPEEEEEEDTTQSPSQVQPVIDYYVLQPQGTNCVPLEKN